ncbi:MAG: hypothetical protein J0665_14480 [Deltaproteobacteria bacterium]|nr:hypothetical protein [Deltaproteobacteria bacterium]
MSDLTGLQNHLDEYWSMLNGQWQITNGYWLDTKRDEFERDYWQTMESEFKKIIEELHRLREVLETVRSKIV